MVLDPSKYKTGNPVPSNKAKDLDDNARVTDVIVNDQSGENVLDRFGNERRTLKGLEVAYLTAIQGIQGNPIGDWTAGVTTFNALNDYAIYNGVPYRARTTTTLPYVAQGSDPTAAPDNAFVYPYTGDKYIYDTTVELAASDLPVGSVAETKGRLDIGDGMAYRYIISSDGSSLRTYDVALVNGNFAIFDGLLSYTGAECGIF